MSGTLSGLSKKYAEDDSPPPVHKTQKPSLNNMEDSSAHSLVNKKMGAICRITFKQPYKDECDLWDNKQLMHPGTSLGVGSGTGFLVAPGYVMTNHHVIPHKSAAEHAKVHFEEKALELNSEEFVSSPVGDAIDKDNLDFTVVALRDPSSIQHLFDKCFDVFKRHHPKNESIVNIIHHPVLSNPFAETRADQKISKILIDSVSEYGVHYRLESNQMEPTAPGSSGGPLFTDHGTLVALHHASGEAIRMDKIAECLGNQWQTKIEESGKYYQGAGLIQELKQHYSKCSNYSQINLNSEGKVSKRKLSFTNYIPPKLIQGEETIDLHSIFCKEMKKNCTLILGEAGTGKRTLCKYISYAWAHLNFWPHFKGIFLISLKNLTIEHYPDAYKNSHTLEDVFHRECELSLNLLNNVDLEHSLLILEGYHSLSKQEKDKSLRKFVEKKLIPAFNHILISSRSEDVPTEVTSKFEIKGFLEDSRKAYIDLFFQKEGFQKAIELKELIKDDMLSDLAVTPIGLNLICLSYQQFSRIDLIRIRLSIKLVSLEAIIQQWNKQLIPNDENSKIGPLKPIMDAIYSDEIEVAWNRLSDLIARSSYESDPFQFVIDQAKELITATSTEAESVKIKPLIAHLVHFLVAKQATLITHLHIYKTFSQHIHLEPLRKEYVNALAGHEFYQTILAVPNPTGFRQSFRIEREALLTSIQRLCTNTFSDCSQLYVEIEVPGLTCKQLDSKLVSELIIPESGLINPFIDQKKEYKNCHHTVRSLPDYGLHIKERPDQPCMEYAICSLMHRLFNHGPPITQLAKVTVKYKERVINSYPVLFSKTIVGEIFDPSQIEELDPAHLTELLISQVLFLPGEAVSRNFVRQGKTLISLDNRSYFVEPMVQLKEGWSTIKKIQFTSILFCLNNLKQLDREAVTQFCNLEPLTILSEWLKDVIEQEKTYKSLFPDFKTKKALFETDRDRAFTPFLVLAPGSIARLCEQFLALQAFLKEKSSPTPLDLLEAIIGRNNQTTLETSKVGTSIKAAYQNVKGLSPTERLQEAVQRDPSQSLTSSQVLQAQLGKIPSAKELEEEETFSLKKAFHELFESNHGGYYGVGKNANCKKQETYFQKIKKDGRPDRERQHLVLTSLIHSLPQDTTALNLSYCEALDNQLLEIILHKYYSLQVLDLRFCSSITSRSIEKIAQLCPKLQELYLSGCSQLTEIGVIQNGGLEPIIFNELKVLHLADCPKLTQVSLSAEALSEIKMDGRHELSLDVLQTPNLEKLICSFIADFTQIREFTNLKSLEISNSTLTNTDLRELFQNNPGLLHVRLIMCPKVTFLPAHPSLQTLRLAYFPLSKIEGNYPFLTYLHFKHCGYLEEVKITSPLLEQFHAKKCLKLKLVEIESSKLAVLDLAGSPYVECTQTNLFQHTALEYLDLSSNKSLSKAAIEKLSQMLPYLKRLCLNECMSAGGELSFNEPFVLLSRLHIENVALGKLSIQAPGLKRLYVKGNQNFILENFWFPKLQTFESTNCTISNLEQIQELPKTCEKILTLHVNTHELLEDLLVTLPHLGRILIYLHFELSVDDLMKLLSAFPALIVGLEFTGVLGDEGAKTIANLLPANRIAQLILKNTHIGFDGAEAIAKALPSSHIVYLDLSENSLKDKGTKAIANMLSSSPITQLNLAENKIGPNGAKAIANTLPFSTIIGLNLNGNCIGAEGAVAIAKALPFSQVSQLVLKCASIGDTGAKAIAEVLPYSRVNHIDFTRNNIGQEGIEALTNMLPFSQVNRFYLGWNAFESEGVKVLANALPFSQIAQLYIEGNSIGDEGSEAIAQALPSSLVTHLDLSKNNIGPDGTKALTNVLRSSQVTQINLDWNGIGDDGAKAIANGLASSIITRLILTKCKIKSIGVEAIAAVLPFCHITQLDLAGNKISETTKKILRNAAGDRITLTLN